MTTKHEIGAVAKITGLTIHNLRVWERRHNAVIPERSNDGRRLYSDQDIDRLILLKRCVDHGDRIGTIAKLDQDDLRSRAEKFDERTQHREAAQPATSALSLGLAGMPLFRKTLEKDALRSNGAISIRFGVSAVRDIATAYQQQAVDCVVVELSNITNELADQLIKLVHSIQGTPIIALHHFSRSDIRAELEACNIWPINSNVSSEAIFETAAKRSRAALHPTPSLSEINEPNPKALLNPMQLSVLHTLDSSIPCECPKHLSRIISSLQAFEEYSGNCEITNETEGKLHAEASHTTAHARHALERLLLKILQADGVDVNELSGPESDA